MLGFLVRGSWSVAQPVNRHFCCVHVRGFAEITQHLPSRSASGPVRAVAGRTRDVLDAVVGICRMRAPTCGRSEF